MSTRCGPSRSEPWRQGSARSPDRTAARRSPPRLALGWGLDRERPAGETRRTRFWGVWGSLDGPWRSSREPAVLLARQQGGGMTRLCRCFVLGGFALGTLALAPAASAGHKQEPRTSNRHPLGHIGEPAVLGGFGGANPDSNTDIAFQGKLAFQGNWDGFSIRDISAPGNPRTISRTF